MPFSRETVRHELVKRRVHVAAVRSLAPSMVRITLAGPELDGFRALGPADHVKVFFPDPASGVLTLERGEGVMISRDYTPLHVRPDASGTDASGATTLDIDFVLHGVDGPASAWAATAQPGDELGLGGPHGSRLVPEGIGRLLVVADETALPATRRWLELLPASVPVTALLDLADDSLDGYFDDLSGNGLHGTDRFEPERLYREDGPNQLDEALRSLGPIGDDTFVFMAGEAAALIPLRRYLRRELGLPSEQVSASGYWKRGIVNLDHHAPLDPSDPD